MALLFSLIFLASLILFLLGLSNPQKSLWWYKGEKTKTTSRRYYGWTMIASIILVGVSAPNKDVNPTNIQTSQPPNNTTQSVETVIESEIQISAKNLVSEYAKNEVRADKMFRDKKLAVTGVITKIHKDILGDPYIILKGDGFLNNVQCFTDENTASELNINTKITIIGSCEGLMMNVILKDCKLYSE